MNKVTIYTDGGCRGNGKEDNVGAYAYIIIEDNVDNIEVTESFDSTTNNKMELLGLITALESLETPRLVNAFSDSQYVCNAINQNWINNWQKNGWKTAKKEAVKNQDLWIRLINQLNKHHVTIKWVKGHSGDEFNERCDEILNEAMNSHTPTSKVEKQDIDIDLDSISKAAEQDVAILKRLIAMRDELNELINVVSTR